ncbi:PF20097 family protein [Thioalkalicoccus limnaeus]|uniref:PF20097 family protein n=1 Tax=Thioalkalicoccus limnaeus TaxID=120681 RepID=A0ABV4BAR3_9GAMM
MSGLPDSALTMILLFLLIVLTILWALYRLSRRHVAVAHRPELWQGRNYRCPSCATPMRQGWVMLGRGAIFAPRGQTPPGTFAHIGQALDNTISLAWRPAANMAWHCPHCRLLLIDHDKLVRP